VVDRGSNRKVSKNPIGGVKVSRIVCGRSRVKQKSIKESHRGRLCDSLILFCFIHDLPHSILLTFTPPMGFFDTFLFDPRSTTLDSAILYTTYVIL
jgi:hypothetical protein